MLGQKCLLEKNITLSSPAAMAHMRLHMCAFSQECFVGPDLGPSYLKRLSGDDTSSRWLTTEIGAEKRNITLSSRAAKAKTRLHIRAFSQEHFVGPDLGPKLCNVYQQTTLVQMIVDMNGRRKKKYNVHFRSSSEGLWARSGNNTHCYKLTNKSKHMIGQIWALKCYNTSSWTAKAHLRQHNVMWFLYLLHFWAKKAQVTLHRFARAFPFIHTK